MIEKLKNIPIDMNGNPSVVWVKINELVDAVNKLQTRAENVQPDTESRPENVRPSKIVYANKRLRKALGVAQTALVKLANDAYDMDEHIYIDGILNQIERITKGGRDG